MEEEEDLDIAAAMGFGSFGGTKKRKFDHTSSPKATVDASGANSTKLGMRTKKMSSAGGMDANNPTGSLDQTAQSQSVAPTSTANITEEPSAASGLAAFLARGQSLPEKPFSTQQAESTSAQVNQSSSDMVSFGGPLISKSELNALRFGLKNENGDTAYFLSNFVEDPWEKLTKSGGA